MAKKTAISLEQLLSTEADSKLLAIWHELSTLTAPATGYAHEYCRYVNRRIDKGEVQVRPDSYRHIYLSTLSKFVMAELAARYVNYCLNEKGGEQ